MLSFNNYVSTAIQCSRYSPRIENEFSNSSGELKSCLKCKNFENNHCKLDLYDQINNS